MRKLGFILVIWIILTSCASLRGRTYEETLAGWKSYNDVSRWMTWHFTYDTERFKSSYRAEVSAEFLPRTAEQTFKLRSGICYDAAVFIQRSLDRINPSYEARIVCIVNAPLEANHYVCSFKLNGKIFIMDYGTGYRGDIGTHGPFSSLDGYLRYYRKSHPYAKSAGYS